MKSGTEERSRVARSGRERHVPSPIAVAAATLLAVGALATVVLVVMLNPKSDDPRSQLAQAERLLESGLATDDTATYARADQLFAAILESSPNDARALRGAATVDLGLHRFAAAAAKSEATLATQPNDHVALAALIDATIELGNYDEASELIDRLFRTRPGVEAYSRLSYLHQLRGDDDAAIEAMFLARAATVDNSPAAARVEALLGELYHTVGRQGTAIERYRQAISIDGSRSDYTVELASALAANGQRGEATQLVEQLLEADAGDASALMLLVELQAVELDGDGLTGSGVAGSIDSPAGPTTSSRNGAVELVVASARSDLAAGYGIDPSQALFEASYADPVKALELADLIHQRRPQNIKADHALAWALHRNGRTDEAVEHLEAALRFDTTDIMLHQHAAEVFAAIGDNDRAKQHRQRVEAILDTP